MILAFYFLAISGTRIFVKPDVNMEKMKEIGTLQKRYITKGGISLNYLLYQ